MGHETPVIRAFKAFKSGLRPARTWGNSLSGDAWKSRGSSNIPPMAYACELWLSPGNEDVIEWWMDWCDSQEDGKVGHSGRELGSRIYDPWTTTAAIMALAKAKEPLKGRLKKWLRRHWLLYALGATPRSQAQSWQHKIWTSTLCGMRSCAKKGAKKQIRDAHWAGDGLFCMAIGQPFAIDREYWEHDVCKGLDMGLTNEEATALRDYVAGRVSYGYMVDHFIGDLSGLATRVPIHFVRWADGSVGTMVERDCGTSTPPVYALLMRGKGDTPGEYLCPYRAGEKYTHGDAGWGDGYWWAKIPEREERIDLPGADILVHVTIDSDGYKDDAAWSPVPEPQPPSDLPPVRHDPKLEDRLEDALILAKKGDYVWSKKHVERALEYLSELVDV